MRYITLHLGGSPGTEAGPSSRPEHCSRQHLILGRLLPLSGSQDRSAISAGQAPQPQAGPRAVGLDALGGRRLETCYIPFVISRQRVSAGRYGVPHLKSTGP